MLGLEAVPILDLLRNCPTGFYPPTATPNVELLFSLSSRVLAITVLPNVGHADGGATRLLVVLINLSLTTKSSTYFPCYYLFRLFYLLQTACRVYVQPWVGSVVLSLTERGSSRVQTQVLIYISPFTPSLFVNFSVLSLVKKKLKNHFNMITLIVFSLYCLGFPCLV